MKEMLYEFASIRLDIGPPETKKNINGKVKVVGSAQNIC